MSQQKQGVPSSIKTERWVIFMALAFVPVVAALFVPEAARIALVAVGGLLFVVGFALMFIESKRSRGGETLRHLVHADRD